MLHSQLNRDMVWDDRNLAQVALASMISLREIEKYMEFDPCSYQDIAKPTYPIRPALFSKTPTEEEIQKYSKQLADYNLLVANHDRLVNEYEQSMQSWFADFRKHLYHKYLGGQDARVKELDDVIYKHAYSRYITASTTDVDDDATIDFVAVAKEYAIEVAFAVAIVNRLEEKKTT